MNVDAGLAGTHVGDAQAVVLGGPISVRVAGAVSPLKKFFWIIASSFFVAPRGPYPVDLIKRRIGSGDVIDPTIWLSAATPPELAIRVAANPLG